MRKELLCLTISSILFLENAVANDNTPKPTRPNTNHVRLHELEEALTLREQIGPQSDTNQEGHDLIKAGESKDKSHKRFMRSLRENILNKEKVQQELAESEIKNGSSNFRVNDLKQLTNGKAIEEKTIQKDGKTKTIHKIQLETQPGVKAEGTRTLTEYKDGSVKVKLKVERESLAETTDEKGYNVSSHYKETSKKSEKRSNSGNVEIKNTFAAESKINAGKSSSVYTTRESRVSQHKVKSEDEAATHLNQENATFRRKVETQSKHENGYTFGQTRDFSAQKKSKESLVTSHFSEEHYDNNQKKIMNHISINENPNHNLKRK